MVLETPMAVAKFKPDIISHIVFFSKQEWERKSQRRKVVEDVTQESRDFYFPKQCPRNDDSQSLYLPLKRRLCRVFPVRLLFWVMPVIEIDFLTPGELITGSWKLMAQLGSTTTWATKIKKLGYFPLNPGCLIGILSSAYYNPLNFWVGFHPNKSPKQPRFFSLLTCASITKETKCWSPCTWSFISQIPPWMKRSDWRSYVHPWNLTCFTWKSASSKGDSLLKHLIISGSILYSFFFVPKDHSVGFDHPPTFLPQPVAHRFPFKTMHQETLGSTYCPKRLGS